MAEFEGMLTAEGMKIGIVNIMVNDETDYALGCMHSPYLLK